MASGMAKGQVLCELVSIDLPNSIFIFYDGQFCQSNALHRPAHIGNPRKPTQALNVQINSTITSLVLEKSSRYDNIVQSKDDG